MKKVVLLALSLLMIVLCLTGCDYYLLRNTVDNIQDSDSKFYVKTSPCIGDAGIDTVISMEAKYKTYTGTGDITIPFTVGFGHLPDSPAPYIGSSGFCAVYSVYDEYEWDKSAEPEWQHIVEYTDSFYSEKYNSTEQKNSSIFFVIPVYGQFYPLYTETVYITFPADIQDGDVVVDVEGARTLLFFKFSRNGDTLTLMEDKYQ